MSEVIEGEVPHWCVPRIPDIAELAAERIDATLRRARPVARGVALLTTACGVLAYVVGLLVFHGSARTGWAIIGVLLCAVPSVAIWRAYSRLRHAGRAIGSLAGSLASLMSDRRGRDALVELAERDSDPRDAPLVTLGKDLITIRRVLNDRRQEVSDLRQAVVAITTLPGLMALAILGSVGLLILSVVFAVYGALT
jgi:hypothetical protein